MASTQTDLIENFHNDRYNSMDFVTTKFIAISQEIKSYIVSYQNYKLIDRKAYSNPKNPFETVEDIIIFLRKDISDSVIKEFDDIQQPIIQESHTMAVIFVFEVVDGQVVDTNVLSREIKESINEKFSQVIYTDGMGHLDLVNRLPSGVLFYVPMTDISHFEDFVNSSGTYICMPRQISMSIAIETCEFEAFNKLIRQEDVRVLTTTSLWKLNMAATETSLRKSDLDESKRRYHQIWRDAYSSKVDELLDRSYNLVYDVLRKLSHPANDQQIVQLIGTKEVDQNTTESIQFIRKRAKLSWEEIEPLLGVDNVDGLKAGLSLLVEFTNKLDGLIRSYYSIECANLTEEDNLVFAQGLRSLHEEFNLPIRQKLSCTTPDTLEFHQVAQKLRKLGERVNFKVHLPPTDESKYTKKAVAYGKKELTHSFGPKGVALFHQAMYGWLDSLSDTQFHALVYSSLKNAHLNGSWFNWMGFASRKEEVDNYFKILKSHSKIVANIFVHGKEESGLNTTLFNNIITTMKQDINSNPEMQVLPQYKYILNYTNGDDLPNYLNTLKRYAVAQIHVQEKVELTPTAEASCSYSV